MILLIGAGGNAIDAISFLFKNESIQFIDDEKTGKFLNYPIIGTIDKLVNKEIKDLSYSKIYLCIGSSGNNRTRNRIYEKLTKAGIKTSPLIFPSHISKNVKIGENVLIGLNSQIHHDCVIGSNVVLSPRVTLCGDVTIKDNVFIGAGAVIIQGCKISKNAIVGAGSVVLHDIEENSTYVGNPAKKVKGVG